MLLQRSSCFCINLATCLRRCFAISTDLAPKSKSFPFRWTFINSVFTQTFKMLGLDESDEIGRTWWRYSRSNSVDRLLSSIWAVTPEIYGSEIYILIEIRDSTWRYSDPLSPSFPASSIFAAFPGQYVDAHYKSGIRTNMWHTWYSYTSTAGNWIKIGSSSYLEILKGVRVSFYRGYRQN